MGVGNFNSLKSQVKKEGEDQFEPVLNINTSLFPTLAGMFLFAPLQLSSHNTILRQKKYWRGIFPLAPSPKLRLWFLQSNTEIRVVLSCRPLPPPSKYYVKFLKYSQFHSTLYNQYSCHNVVKQLMINLSHAGRVDSMLSSDPALRATSMPSLFLQQRTSDIQGRRQP